MNELLGKRVRISTPSIDGKYQGEYVLSLINTLRLIESCGGNANWSRMPYCSDIAFARNRMLGAFLRSDDTHMVMIDADMGWRPEDVVRMVLAGVGFVAGVGQRKVMPPEYCVEPQIAVPGHLIRVDAVGMAFSCLSRECADRVHRATAGFVAPDGEFEAGAFNPTIVEGRYRSEDYSFCHRWRDIGGHIWIMPDIVLSHFGTHNWQGAWIDAMMPKDKSEAA